MSSAPKKYVKINGVMKMNPEYKVWKNMQAGGPIAPAGPGNQNAALAVVSNMEDHMQLNEDLGVDVPLSESTDATIEMMQEPEISLQAGMQPDEMVDKLGAILGKYEVPMGLMNKLIMLSEFASLEIIVDDSGSMQMNSDTINPVTKKFNTRWEEAHERLKEMLEILAYVPFQQIGIEFLNRKDRVSLKRNGMTPTAFLVGANQQIDAQFSRGPSGTTPALEKLQESLLRGQGVSIARYFFGDGLPNGGDRAIKEIVRIIRHRPDPEMNPITFLSCTNEDAAVEWMKECEEVAPFCSESDDFGDESREVLEDQGEALPYTRGFWLICQLVAAMNPDDLDAMDESVPFTKTTLDNLLGIRHNEETFKYYFEAFVQNQRKRNEYTPMNRLKKNTRWKYHDFLTALVAKDIPQVQEFNRKMNLLIQ
uniref:Uncharacterized protein n=2 Tax=Pseudo-nitzschia australis TaxID=44445 RepID=A0A7S4AT88_9STRA|mmetsp:Transcript_17795/g.38852  ORF Transcript_17795/g.38852 Transcript_17795/m.38852 type:complete len:423 (+) Transcript_17795:206-1474(+)|eukprot:CAMPEP_0168174944 /NCGR_PEP_ID=MMETSP0139_2-20121125/6818_1 /TAXON_ID=44445 /ORGANISM="Pseudo-nitzschia australis, Strain 10249 10 AB" /LENGTH=422 /DNA_ID=CAMNT_0008093217 /DNA_START=125 /DNA_END=1393 /DNA_ORIENTATION=-